MSYKIFHDVYNVLATVVCNMQRLEQKTDSKGVYKVTRIS